MVWKYCPRSVLFESQLSFKRTRESGGSNIPLAESPSNNAAQTLTLRKHEMRPISSHLNRISSHDSTSFRSSLSSPSETLTILETVVKVLMNLKLAGVQLG